MRILHYSIGLPPFRTGGLTKYSYDLMREQIRLKDQVYLLYPGHFRVLGKTKIISNKPKNGIEIFELVNPLPVPLLGGIKTPEAFLKSVDKAIYLNFLKEIKPDIIHVHSLMGLHKEFLDAAGELKIKTVYTSHDYFGLCPKVNFIDNNNNTCDGNKSCNKCPECNTNAYSLKLIYLMQSKIYRKVKDLDFVKKMRRQKKDSIREAQKTDTSNSNNIIATANEYIKLRKYYVSMLKAIDYFHFNSTIAKKQYEKYVTQIKGEVISICHSDISDKRVERRYNGSDKLRITFLGNLEQYKGFFMLEKTLLKMSGMGLNNWHLNIYGNAEGEKCSINEKQVTLHGRYGHPDLKKIFDNTDVMIIPSIWQETFGFVGLEALSYGVPVILTENVGLKDIVAQNEMGIIIKPTSDELRRALTQIIDNRNILSDLNSNILKSKYSFNMSGHTLEIANLYERVSDRGQSSAKIS